MPTVEIVLKTIDESTKTTKKVKEEYESLVPGLEKAGQSVTSFVSKNATLIAALVGVGVAVKGAFDDFQKYAGEVRDLALASGTTATEASILLQVLDDFQVSAQDVTAATRAMTKEGLTPNLETLAKLSDQYLSITDAQERNEFVIKNLGRAGLQWVNVLNQGGDALRAMSGEVDKNLILNDQMIRDAELQRLAIDELSDTWQGLTVQFGAAAGQQILNIQAQEKAYDILREQGVAITGTTMFTKEYADALALAKEEQLAETETTNQNTEALKKNEEEILKITEHNKEYLASIASISEQHRDYTKTVEDLNAEHADLLAEKQKLIAEGYSPEGQNILDINSKLDANIQKQQEAAAEFELAGRKRILSMLEQQLAIDGLDERETDYLLSKGLEWGVYSQSAVDAAKAAQKEVLQLTAALNAVPTQKTITITTYQYQQATGMPGMYGFNKTTTHAMGGSFIVPSTGGNENWGLGGGHTASAGEQVTVTPEGQDVIDYKKMGKEVARALVTALAQA